MLSVLILAAIVAATTAISVVHGLGLWLFLMVVHGALVTALGDSAVHLPMYAGTSVVVVVLLKNRWRPIQPLFLALFVGLVGVMSIAALSGLDQTTSTEELLNYGKAILLSAVVAGSITTVKEARVLSFYLLASLVAGALLTLYQKYTGHYAIKTIYEARAAGLRTDPNDTAMLLVAGVPLQIYWFLRAKGLLRIPMLLGFGLLHLGILLTGSRGGFVALVAVYAIMYLRRPSVLTTIAGAVLVMTAALAAPQSYRDHIMTLITLREPHGGISLQSREQLLIGGLTILKEHSALGVGAGNFGRAFVMQTAADTGSFNSDAIIDTVGGVAHNMYLEFFVENGVIGGVVFLAIIWFSLRGLTALREADRAIGPWSRSYGLGFMLMTSMAGMLVSGLFLSQGKNSVLWFLIGLGLATIRSDVQQIAATPVALEGATSC